MLNITRTLRETRFEDRIKMAREVRQITKEFGGPAAISRIELDPLYELGDIQVTITSRRSLTVNVEFSGNKPKDYINVFVLSWFFSRSGDAKLRTSFAQGVNTVHRRKATDVFRGYPALMQGLQQRLQAIDEERAFVVE